MNDAEIIQALLRAQERKIAWAIIPPLFVIAYLLGRYQHEHPFVTPPVAPKADPKMAPLVVDKPHDDRFASERQELEPPGPLTPIRRVPEKKEDWPWGIPPGGIGSEYPKGASDAERQRWAEAQNERIRLFNSGVPPNN